MKHHFLFLGFGYTAQAMVPALAGAGFLISGTHRTPLFSVNPSVDLISFNSPRMEELVKNASHILISIPPDETGSDIVLSTYSDLISAHAATIKWIGYLSSTGVYGDYHGDWVNENSTCQPLGTNAIARFAAEKSWLAFAKKHHLPVHIFRLAGIMAAGAMRLLALKQGKSRVFTKKDTIFHGFTLMTLLMY